MPQVTFIQPDGSRNVVEIAEGMSVMQGSLFHALPGIVGECGGSAMCATCHVYVPERWLHRLPAVSDAEDAMLESATGERRPNSRLGCQIRLTASLDGLVLTLPESQT